MNNNSLSLLGQLHLMETRGYSAYEVAVINGFEGTEEEWLASLVGPQGPQGPDGKSAYQVAVDNGYTGTEEEWVNDFMTPDGYYTKGEVDVKKATFVNTVEEMKSLNAIENSFVVTAGYHEINDDGGSLYKIIDDDNLTDNGSTIIELDNGLFAILIVETEVTPEQFGCYGDGVHDDTTALQNAIDSGYNIIARNTYSITNVYIKNITFTLRGRIDGRVKIGRRAIFTGGEVHAKTNSATIELVNDTNNPRNMFSTVENVRIYPTNDGIGIYCNATEYSMFNFVVQNCDVNNSAIGIKLENADSHWITKSDFNNIFLHTPEVGIKMINTGNISNMSGMVFRNIFAQYYDSKPNYFFDIDLAQISIYNCVCYDGIQIATYNVTNDSSKIQINNPVHISDNTCSENTDPKVLRFDSLSLTDGGSILRANRNMQYIKQITNGMINPTVSGTTGLAQTGLPFLGFVGIAGKNISNDSKYSAVNFWNGRLAVGSSSTASSDSFSMVEVTTPYSGAVYTSSTLPASVRDGATCWCSDLHMTLTYYSSHWYKPDGTQFS